MWRFCLRMSFLLLIVAVSTSAAYPPPKAHSGYQFLGNLRTFTRTDAGILLKCENDVRLEIQFLKPEMFRVTLVRPNYPNELLAYPLARSEWPPVSLQLEEKDTYLRLISKEIDILIHKMPCRISVLDKQGNVINRDDPGMGIGWDGKEVRCWKSLGQGERFFGLGEKTGDVDKYRREWVMWNSDIPGYDQRTDPLYQSIPFYIGLHKGQAYGIYFNNSYRSTFNFGAGNERYASFSAVDGPLDYFFIYGPKINRVVATYTELTGRIELPPRWALGYQQCRWSYYPDSEVLTLAKTFRDKKIPADVIYLDIHYMDGYRVFTWHPERFPHPGELLQTLQEMGFKVVTIIDPGVKAEESYAVAREGLAGEHFVTYPDGETYVGEVWPGRAFFPDFGRPETRRWWGRHLANLLDSGVDGFWNDMNEPAVWGQAFPNEAQMHDGARLSSFKKMHNLYGFLMAQTAWEAFRTHRPQQRPFVITRAGFAGEQRFTTVWTGDNAATSEDLELGIRMLLGLGLSGVPFVGMDVGGFIGTPSPELYARWLAACIFSPFLRTHSQQDTPDQEPWSFGESVEAISRQFIELRYRMLPYLYTQVWEAQESGSPVLRPLFWHYQDDPSVYERAYQHQFLVGENLLVAPLTRVGERFKKVYLPAGQWLDLNTGEIYAGGQTVIVEAPLERLPMFLREGGMIATQPVMQYVGEKVADRLTLEVFLRGQYGTYLHYEDDGETRAYLDGQYRLTQFETDFQNDHYTFTANRLYDHFTPAPRLLEVRFRGIRTAPGRVQLDQNPLPALDAAAADQPGYFYDASAQILTIRFPDDRETRRIHIAR